MLQLNPLNGGQTMTGAMASLAVATIVAAGVLLETQFTPIVLGVVVLGFVGLGLLGRFRRSSRQGSNAD